MFAVVVALPKMMTSCGADVSSIQWVMTGYQISRAVPMPALGWMVGLMGSRNLYGLGVIGATLCNMLAPPCSTAGCIRPDCLGLPRSGKIGTIGLDDRLEPPGSQAPC